MATRPQTTPTHVPQDMDKWTHVFVWNDAVHGPLNSPYLGPFKILSQAEKHFKLDMNGRTEIVSADRLKKAHFECDTTDLNVVDTPNFNPLQSPLHTPTPSPSPPPIPDPPPQTEKIYKTKSGRTIHWLKKTVQDLLHLNAICCTFSFVVFIVYIVHSCAVRLLCSFPSFCYNRCYFSNIMCSPTFVLVAELLWQKQFQTII